MPNAWVIHVKQWAAKNNKSYGCAVSDPECRSSYKKPEKEKKTTRETRDKQKYNTGEVLRLRNRIYTLQKEARPSLIKRFNALDVDSKKFIKKYYLSDYNKLFNIKQNPNYGIPDYNTYI